MLIADFTVTAIENKITIVDNSTALYGGETITSRLIEIVKSNGTTIVVPMPLVLGRLDSATYDLVNDSAVALKITLVPTITVAGSIYTKVKNILVVSKLLTKINQYRAEKILGGCFDFKDKDDSDLKIIEVLDSCLITAKSFIGTDLIRSQKALDIGNELVDNNNYC